MNDNRSTVKVRLKNILQGNIDYSCFFDCISRANKWINNGYLFLRAYLLYILEQNEITLIPISIWILKWLYINQIIFITVPIKNWNRYKKKIGEPQINKKFINCVFKTLLDETLIKGGRKNENESKNIKKPILEFLKIYMLGTGFKKINGNKIGKIIESECSNIYTEIINNITLHFEKYINKLVEAKLVKQYKSINDTYKDDNDILRNKLDELKHLKEEMINDLIYKTNKCTKYENWINKYHKYIPTTYIYNDNLTDVERNTFKYLKCMYNFNKYIQKKELKGYQIIPLRTSCYNRYIKIDTTSLVKIFSNNQSRDKSLTGNIDKQKEFWRTYFKLYKNNNECIYKLKNCSFNYEIATDGFACSLNFIKNDKISIKEKKKQNLRDARINVFNKKMNDNEKIKHNEEKIKKDLDKKDQRNKESKEKMKKLREEYKIKSKYEQEKIKLEKQEKVEFPYIETLIKNNIFGEKIRKEYENGNVIFIDPGKRCPLYIMSSKGIIHIPKKKSKRNNFGISTWKNRKFMNYTNNTRMKFTKRKKHLQLIDNWKKKSPIKLAVRDNRYNKLQFLMKTLKQIEEELSKYSAKSCSLKEFLKYVKLKFQHYNKAEQYDTTYIQKLKWFSYVNKCKHEDKLISTIKNEFGENVIIIIGDWSDSGKLKFISTPNIGLKRKLKKHFKVYLINEYLKIKTILILFLFIE